MLSLVSGKFEVVNYFVILTACVLAARPVISYDRSSLNVQVIIELGHTSGNGGKGVPLDVRLSEFLN